MSRLQVTKTFVWTIYSVLHFESVTIQKFQLKNNYLESAENTNRQLKIDIYLANGQLENGC